jgi:hypothetical protein
MAATRDMALALLGTYRAVQAADREPARIPAIEAVPAAPAAEPTFSPTLMRMSQERARQQRREQDYRARERQLRQAILRHEHRLAELKGELVRLEAESPSA